VLELELFDLERALVSESQHSNPNIVNSFVDIDGNTMDLVEEITPLFTREYTIVGVIENIGHHFIDSFAEGSTIVVTYIDEPNRNINLFVYYSNPRETDEINAILLDAFGVDGESSTFINRELLRWQGAVRRRHFKTAIWYSYSSNWSYNTHKCFCYTKWICYIYIRKK